MFLKPVCHLQELDISGNEILYGWKASKRYSTAGLLSEDLTFITTPYDFFVELLSCSRDLEVLGIENCSISNPKHGEMLERAMDFLGSTGHVFKQIRLDGNRGIDFSARDAIFLMLRDLRPKTESNANE
jgi:hypothetical protein